LYCGQSTIEAEESYPLFQSQPPSNSAPKPEVISSDTQQKRQEPRPGWRDWLITILVIAVILALIVIMLFELPE
jgi:hypothetical protein